MGYSFNPVSFWYLYTHSNDLRAMILEVNNTFDERRMYFLKQDLTRTIDVSLDGEGNTRMNSDASLAADIYPSHNFVKAWSKDFHVSPFNSRKGSYSLKATDLFPSNLKHSLHVSNIITLSSSKGYPKLVARIDSTATGIDPARLGYWETIWCVGSWWWVGFVTFPRIVREAVKLYFKRKLHVWYRPEVLSSSIGRKSTSYER